MNREDEFLKDDTLLDNIEKAERETEKENRRSTSRKSRLDTLFTVVLALLAGLTGMQLFLVTFNNASSKNKIVTSNGKVVIHQVTVRGEGKAYAAPDQASFDVDITAKGDDSEDAMERLNRAVEKVTERLTDNGIKKADIKTDDVSCYPSTSYDEDDDIIDDYTAYTTISVEDIKIKTAEEAYGDISSMSANREYLTISANSLYADVSDKSDVYDKAVKDAMKDARQKAEMMAKESGMKVKSVLNVSEYEGDNTSMSSYGSYDINSSVDSATVGSGSKEDTTIPKISKGKRKTTADIKVTFVME